MELTERQEAIVLGWGKTIAERWSVTGDEGALLLTLKQREQAREDEAERARIAALNVTVVLSGPDVLKLRSLLERQARDEGSGPEDEDLLSRLTVDPPLDEPSSAW